jgi:hypothetical protein
MSCDDPSLNCPVAVNCCVLPTAKVDDDGVTVMLCRTALLIVTGKVIETDPSDAVMFAVPAATPWIMPLLSTVATAGFEL